MTSTTDTAGHPEVEELSDLSEGLLPSARTADVRRHLDYCALCADVYDSLEEIRGLLGTVSGPPRMPDDVASRIDAALAAEALLNATAPDTAANTPSSDLAVAHVSRETSPSFPDDRPSGHARAATGPGRTPRTRRGRRVVALGAVIAAAALGLGALLVQTLGNDSGKAPPTAAPETDAAHTYSESSLQSQVAGLLAAKKTNEGRSGSARPWSAESDSGTTGSTGMRPNKTFQDTTVNVPSCIGTAIHTNEALLAADKGVYQGRAVYLVVTPAASDNTRVTAYIVDAACVQSSAATGKVLLTHSYARS